MTGGLRKKAPKLPEQASAARPQACLTFALRRQVSTEEWRTMLAAWLLQLGPDSGLDDGDLHAVFHHQSDGLPAIGLALHRFYCSANTGRVYAVGGEAVARLSRISAAVIKSEATGLWPKPGVLLFQGVSIAPVEHALGYTVNDLVVCRYAEQYKRWSNSSKAARWLHVQDILERGLERQVGALGMDFQVPSPVVLNVSHERAVPKLTRQGSTKAFVRLASVVFTLPVALDGHWVAGGLINRGYGRIVAC